MKPKIDSYVILGPWSDYYGSTYWNMDKQEWVHDFYEADIYPIDIFMVPLPEGATGIMASSVAGEPLGQYDLTTPSLGDKGAVNIFKKSY